MTFPERDIRTGIEVCATDDGEPDAIASLAAQERTARLAAAAARRRAQKLVRAAVPVPTQDPIYNGHSLADLREMRSRLTTEEVRASYWLHAMRARRDLVTTGRHGGNPLNDIGPALIEAREALARLASIDVHPVDERDPLPDLPELWSRPVAPTGPPAVDALVADLHAAESRLSTHHADLNRRLALVAGELIARYRVHPALALTILPSDSSRH